MARGDGKAMLVAWVDPVLRDLARAASESAGESFSRWIERAIQRLASKESMDRAIAKADLMLEGE